MEEVLQIPVTWQAYCITVPCSCFLVYLEVCLPALSPSGKAQAGFREGPGC